MSRSENVYAQILETLTNISKQKASSDEKFGELVAAELSDIKYESKKKKLKHGILSIIYEN